MQTKLFFCFIVFSCSLCAQEGVNDKQNIAVVTDSEPTYVKGENQLYVDVLYNTQYPEEAKKKYVEGNITLSFDVKTDSTITNCMVITSLDKATDEALMNYVKTLKFVPGKQNGMLIKMNTMYTFPVKAH